MRIDGGTKASGGEQAQSRFEQAMARELSRASGGKTSAEGDARASLATASNRKAPSAERVGVDFKAAQAGKALKALQDTVGRLLSKTSAQAGETAKGAFTKLAATAGALTTKAQATMAKEGAAFAKTATGERIGAAVDGLLTRVQTLATAAKEGAATLGKAAAGGGEGGATAALTAKEGGTGTQSPGAQASGTQSSGTQSSGAQSSGAAQGEGQRAGGPAGSQTAQSTAPPILAQRTDAQGIAQGTDRAGTPATPALPAEAPPAPTMAATADAAAGAQDGRAAALSAQNAPATHEGFLLHNPWLHAAARKAKAGGAELSVVLQLGPNVHGAEFVSIATDDTGYITGPEMEIALKDGALDMDDNWVALAGAGTLRGEKIRLEPDADGCAFVSDGEPGQPETVTAWIAGGDALHAKVINIRHVR